jgi:ribosomal protein S18 acetylase RimI-like enzyme
VKTRIRPFTRDDFGFAVSRTRREAWDNTAETFQLCLDHDPRGCFVAEVDGEAAGMITSTRYAHSAWLGNLIVLPEWRRRGIGERLMTHAIDALAAGADGVRTFRLEGDPMGIALYRRLGFVAEFVTPRFKKSPPHASRPVEADPLTAADLGAVQEFDRPRFGDDRGKLLELMMKIAPAAFCERADGKLKGYALALPSAAGVRFGPCAADDDETTARLLDAVLSAFSDVTVVTAVPEVNRSAVGVIKAHGFEETPSSLRMRLGPPAADIARDNLVAIASGAMG